MGADLSLIPGMRDRHRQVLAKELHAAGARLIVSDIDPDKVKMVVADNLKDYTFWLTYPQCLSLGTTTGLAFLLD